MNLFKFRSSEAISFSDGFARGWDHAEHAGPGEVIGDPDILVPDGYDIEQYRAGYSAAVTEFFDSVVPEFDCV